MNLPEDFQFSQSSLQDYVDCPRRFQLRYLERRQWPALVSQPVLEYEHRAQQGVVFHQLIHRHQLGLDEQVLGAHIQDVEVQQWWEQYLQHGEQSLPSTRYPETELSVPIGDYQLTARFDLIAIEEGSNAVIVDWKTAQKLPKVEWMQDRLQTVVYRYILATGGDELNGGQAIRPEQIEMRYWYPEFPDQPIRLGYSLEQYEADERYLLELVDQIANRPDFPLTIDERKCSFCVYRSLCKRGIEAGDIADMQDFDEGDDFDLDIDFDQIAEIEF